MVQGSRGFAAFVSALFLLLSVGSAGAQCVGDCDANGFVQDLELRDAVQIALLEKPASACTAYSGSIEVDDLVDAVINAIGGCPTPTPSPSPTVTPTATITSTPVNTNTPGGVSNAVAGGAAVVAKSLGGIPSLVTAIVTGLTKGTATNFAPDEGSAAGACPVDGSATRVCTTPGTGGAQLALSLSACAVSVPDGTLTFNTPTGPIVLTSGAPAACPTGVFPGNSINATADVAGTVANLDGDVQLNTRATLSAIVVPDIPFPLVSCVVTGAQLTVTGSLISAIPNAGGGAILNLLQTGVTLAIGSFNADCVPVQYTLTFNGAAKVSDTSTNEAADVTFSSFVVRVNATGIPTTLEMDGGLNFDCVDGSIVLDTVTPLTSIPGSLCPTGGVIQITTPEGPGAIAYQSDGSVQIDIDKDGTFDNTFPSCIDPMLPLCPE